jgi:hypothetical protein
MLAFAWMQQDKIQRATIRTAGVLAGIQTRHLSHTNLQWYCYTNPTGKVTE